MSRVIAFLNKNKLVFPCVLAFFAICFFGVFCLIHYSDGDDSIFAEMTSTRSYFEYLSYRYETWTGRMGGESLVYLVFRLGGIWFWRIVNALMVVLLPLCLIRISLIAVGQNAVGQNAAGHANIAETQYAAGHSHNAAGHARFAAYKTREIFNWDKLRLLAIAMSGYLMMDVMTFGHSAVWVNGSIFYTWCIVLGFVAAMPAAKFVFCGAYNRRELLYAVPFGIFAAMSIEQIGAVLLAFVALAVFCGAVLGRRLPDGANVGRILDKGLLLQLGSLVVAFVVLFLAPGNSARSAVSYGDWLPPEFLQLSASEHLFLTYQWLVSSFANEGRLFLLCIWLLGILLLLQKKGRLEKPDLRWIVPASIFSVMALLPFAKVNLLSDMGLYYIDPAVKLEVLPSFAAMTFMNKVALFLWTFALAFTVPFLWKVSGKSAFLVLLFGAGLCSEFIMHFSPTIYASGERVYYVASLLFVVVILRLYLNLNIEKWKNAFVASALLFGILNVVVQAALLLEKLKSA